MARAPIYRRTAQAQADWDARLRQFRAGGQQPRSAAQNLYPTHPSSPIHYLSKGNQLPHGSRSRARMSRARRIYPNLE
jgi:hypothetical protein